MVRDSVCLLTPSIHFTPILPLIHLYLTRITSRSFPATMVSQTRSRNKNTHPAAPVMTKAAKVKAGIDPDKPQKKRLTKDARIHELEDEVARLKRPNDPHPSKEPLVSIPLFVLCKYILINSFQFTSDGSSGDGPEVATDPESDDCTLVGGKRKHRVQNQRYATPQPDHPSSHTYYLR